MINPANTAIPPKIGVTLLCDVRPLGIEQRPFNFEIFTIDGITAQVMTNAISNPEIIFVQKGIGIEKMLIGKVKI
jgi:hypothetical protein